jgi:hypothetical protein
MPYMSRSDYHDILGDMDEQEYQGLVGPYGSCPQPQGIGYEVMLAEKELEMSTSRVSTSGGRRMTMTDVSSKLTERLRNGDRMLITQEELRVIGNEALKTLFNYNTVPLSA